MSERTPAEAGWFEDVNRSDLDAAADSIGTGSAESPADWPANAVESGFADDEDDYYEALHEAVIRATRQMVDERERAEDKQLVHSIRAMDDAERTANELAERLAEWAGTLFDDPGSGVEFARELTDTDPKTPAEEPVISFARRVTNLADEADDLREFIERRAPDVAPNLSKMAGPVLAARLMSLAGGLDSLAKKPSGTVQVLGAEDALFAHLAGRGTSPKHGVIFTHEYVRGTRAEDRGSAARAFAGKLALAARVDHYGGEFKQELHDDLRDRIETIHARGDDE